jgi:hypothetical protein
MQHPVSVALREITVFVAFHPQVRKKRSISSHCAVGCVTMKTNNKENLFKAFLSLDGLNNPSNRFTGRIYLHRCELKPQGVNWPLLRVTRMGPFSLDWLTQAIGSPAASQTPGAIFDSQGRNLTPRGKLSPIGKDLLFAPSVFLTLLSVHLWGGERRVSNMCLRGQSSTLGANSCC